MPNFLDEGGGFSVVPKAILNRQVLKANIVGERWKTGRYSRLDFVSNRLAFDDDVEPRSLCIYDRLGIEIGGFGSRFSGTQRCFDQ
jgi:hypothetical protein